MTERCLTIDGAEGEGGGQVVRSSLALPLVTGRPFVIEKIRAGRKKPGLLQQHLTAVLAAAKVGGGEVEGAILGSRRLVFRPGPVRPMVYDALPDHQIAARPPNPQSSRTVTARAPL